MEAKRVFTCFSRLPMELREKIWDEAIQNRSCKPLAHHFTLHNSWCFPMNRLTNVGSKNPPQWSAQLSGLGPHVGRNNTTSSKILEWTLQSNPSGYLLDSGIWGACRESQKAIVRRWRRCHTSLAWFRASGVFNGEEIYPPEDEVIYKSNDGEAEPSPWTERAPDYIRKRDRLIDPYRVQIMSLQEDESSKEIWIVIRAQSDLLICDMPGLRTSKGDEIFGMRYWHGQRDGLPNIALTFNPTWLDSLYHFQSVDDWTVWLYEDSEVGGLSRQFDSFYLRDDFDDITEDCIWLIDSSLQPNPTLSEESLEMIIGQRKVFHSRGQRFVEVLPDDMNEFWYGETFWDGSPYPFNRYTFSHKTAHHFLQRWNRLARELYTRDLFATTSIYEKFLRKTDPECQKVLACLPGSI